MQILERGKAHKANVVYFECDFCGSKFRAIEGDPRIRLDLIDTNRWHLKAVCPICKSKINEDAVYSIREMLTVKEKEEMKHWKEDKLEDLTDDELIYLWTDDAERVYGDRHRNEKEI